MAPKNIKIFKADNSLQLKAGTGQISDFLVSAADELILNNTVDFSEIAPSLLMRLQKSIHHIRSESAGGAERKQALSEVIAAVMELKANGAMFKYPLVSDLAATMLSFLEHIDSVDNDIIDLIDAHEKTLNTIIAKKLRGDGGAVGLQLRKELEGACDRYYRKNPLSFKVPAKTPKKDS